MSLDAYAARLAVGGKPSPRCTVDGCWNAVHARGLCHKHHKPAVCGTCGRKLGPGNYGGLGFHLACEPTTCTCEVPAPNGIGECAGCRRLVVGEGT